MKLPKRERGGSAAFTSSSQTDSANLNQRRESTENAIYIVRVSKSVAQ